MANTAFAHEFTTPCKLVCKCGIHHSFDFLLARLHFFAPYLPRANLYKPNFSFSDERGRNDARNPYLL